LVVILVSLVFSYAFNSEFDLFFGRLLYKKKAAQFAARTSLSIIFLFFKNKSARIYPPVFWLPAS